MDKTEKIVGDDTTGNGGVKIDAPKVTAAEPEKAASPPLEKKLKRTPGQWGVDFILYPVLTNFGVLGLSMVATYLTSKGGDRNASGKLIYGKVGEAFFKRGEWLKDKFKATGMSEGQADMSKMVFFSFADGTLLAPVVKFFEDRREKLSCMIDNKLGTVPDDKAVYKAEPKQSWLSVIGGRLATCLVVVPTAVALDKMGLNDVLFNNPGKKIGAMLAKKPAIAKMFGKHDVQELARIGVFEAFYTSVCTAGLYFSSRNLCNFLKPKESVVAKEDNTPIDTAQDWNHAPVEKKRAVEGLKRPAYSRIAGGFGDKLLAEPTPDLLYR